MARSEHTGALAARARRAYELGRLGAGLRRAWPVVPMAMLSLAGCGQPGFAAGAAALLVAAVTLLSWRGEAWGRAVVPGLLAGALPLVVPLFVRALGHACAGGSCLPVCLVACGASGAAAGALLGVRAARLARGRGAFLAGGALVATLAGALGCVVAGATGLLGMAAGFLAATTPLLVASASRRG